MAVRFSDPPVWRFILTNLAGNVITTLDGRATDRSFDFVHNGPSSMTGLVASDDPEINLPYLLPTNPRFLSNNTRLLYGLRREMSYGTGSPYYSRASGLVMTIEDVAADAPTTRYTAYDPWQYLFKRPARMQDGSLPGRNGIRYKDARPNDMAYDLIANTIAVDGDVFLDVDLANITDCPVISGVTVFERGLSVGAALQQLCDTGFIDIQMRPIYDPGFRPGKLCELHMGPLLGTTRYDAVMYWDQLGANISEMSRLIDGTQLENVVTAYAGAGGEPTTPATDATSRALYGDYYGSAFLSGEEDSTVAVEASGLAELEIRKDGLFSLSFSPAPERALVPLRDYGTGDYVPVWATRRFRQPLGIDYAGFDPDFPGAVGYQRIFQMPMELDDNGVEHVRNIRTSTDVPGG